MNNLSLDTYNINFIDDIIQHNNLSQLDFPDLSSNFNEIQGLDSNKLCNAITYSKYQSLLNFVNLELHNLNSLKRGILNQAKKNFTLNNAQCSFRKTTNKTYHLFQKVDTNIEYLSIISKNEWGPDFKDKYIGSYRLNNDLTWEEI